MNYFHNIKTQKTYAYDAVRGIDEIAQAGLEMTQADKEKTAGMGDFVLSNPDFIRVTAKVYSKFGVKTAIIAKQKKNISVSDLANMSSEEIQALISANKTAEPKPVATKSIKVKKA